MGDSEFITLRDGTVVDLEVLQRLWGLEARGASFVVTAGGFDVKPDGILTRGDRDFLLANLDAARRIVRYEADDGHLGHAAAPQ